MQDIHGKLKDGILDTCKSNLCQYVYIVCPCKSSIPFIAQIIAVRRTHTKRKKSLRTNRGDNGRQWTVWMLKRSACREILLWIKKTIMVLSIVLFRAAYCQYRKALTQRLQSAFTSPSSLSSFSPPNPHTRNASLPSSTLRSPFSLCILLLWLPERPSYEHLLYLLIIVRALLRVWQSDKSAHQRQKNRTTTRRAILHTTKGLFFSLVSSLFLAVLIKASRSNLSNWSWSVALQLFPYASTSTWESWLYPTRI